MPQVSAAVLRSTPSSTSASANIRRAAALSFSPLAALRSSEAVRSSRVIETAVPIDAAPSQKPASSQSLTDLGIPNESQFRAVGIRQHGMASVAHQRDATDAPARQRGAVEQPPLEGFVDGAEDVMDLGMPAGIASLGVFDAATVIPGFAIPAPLLADRYEIQEPAAGDEVMHEVSARPHPVGGDVCEIEMGQSIGGREPAIGDIAGKSRALVAEQVSSDHRMNAIRTDRHVAVDDGAVVEDRPGGTLRLNDLNAAAPAMNPLRRQRRCQDRQKISAMEVVIRRTVGIFNGIPELLPSQNPAIVPAPNLDMRRFDRDAAQRVSKTIAMQEPRGTGAEVNAGPHLGLVSNLLIDVDVATGL